MKLLLVKIQDFMDNQAIKVSNFEVKLEEVDIDFCIDQLK